MNRVYQRIWSKVKERWILVSEKIAHGKGPAAIFGAITLAAFLSLSGTAFAIEPGALPTGGKITSGKGSIATVGKQMTVNQSTDKMIANWKTFNIGARAGVVFKQPDADSAALNRITDQKPSQILGTLSANGKVYLINPSGIVFGKGSQVNVGGLVASSLKMADKDFLAGKNKFYNAGFAEDAGSVVNQGTINAKTGGIVALIAPKVTNEGTITANDGSVILAAGNQVSVDFKGDGLISYTVDKGAVDALAENKGLIKADGGIVVMTAKAADSLTKAVVNNSGIIEAQALQTKEGRIMLLSDMENGTTIVGGKLDASAPNGGNGGYIETSAYDVKIDDYAVITTAAPKGITGTWLIDPYDFTIASSGGDVTGTALSAALGSTDVTIQTLNGSVSCTGVACGSGNPAGNGDIFVNDNITWTQNTLTLNAWRNIEINSGLFGSSTAKLSLLYGQGAVALGNTSIYEVNAPVNLPTGNNFSTKLGSDGTTINYYVITSLGAAGSTTGTDLQGMSGNLAGYYALGTNINAAATSTWNSGAGFVPVGNDITPFTGQFDGLGHTITKLTINRPTEDSIGLFGSSNGSIMNVGLARGRIIGSDNVGALVGHNVGTVNNAYSTAQVIGGSVVGGLVGFNDGGQVTNSYATGSITGVSTIGSGVAVAIDVDNDGDDDVTGMINSGSVVGGLVGLNAGGKIDGTFASGSVTGGSILGGLVGLNEGGQITNSSASGSVTGINGVGDATFTVNMDIAADLNLDGSSDITGNVSGTGTVSGGTIIGGLVGFNDGGTVNETAASGKVIGGSILGGLIGLNEGGQITNSSASGRVTGKSGVGDIAFNMNADFDGSVTYSKDESFEGSIDGLSTISGTGTISGGTIVGGLIGFNAGGTVDATVASGSVTGGNILGGLVGLNLDIPFDGVIGGQISNSSASGNVVGKKGLGDVVFSIDADLDGIIAYAMDANLNGSNDLTGSIDGLSSISGTGTIKGGNMLGGLVGLNAGGTIDGSSASGSVTGGNMLGGLVGLNLDIPFDEFAGGKISNSSATGIIKGKKRLGDMAISMNVDLDGIIAFSADANLDGSNDLTGGVDGVSTISGTGSIKGGNILGGLVGFNVGGTVDGSSAFGSVTGGNILGGLVGLNLDIPFDGVTGGQITDSSASGIITGKKILGHMAASMNADLDGIIIYSADANLDGSIDLIGSVNGVSTVSGAGSIKGGNILGGLVGLNVGGTIGGSDAEGSVTGGNILGGLVGLNLDIPFDGVAGGKISNSSATGSVTGRKGVGDTVFSMNSYLDVDLISDVYSYITGNISGTGKIRGGNIVGGLVGLNAGGSIDGSAASGNVSGGSILGGLVGLNLDIPFDEVIGGQITNSSATGIVAGKSGIGDMVFSMNSYLDSDLDFDDCNYLTFDIDGLSSISGKGSMKGGNIVGGLVGFNAGGSIDGSDASGNVSGGSILGGLVGLNLDIPFDEVIGGQITNSLATGSVTGKSGIGDMAFFMNGNVDGAVAFSMDTNFDGNVDLTGSMDGLSNISGAGSIKGGNIVGGLVGLNAGGNIDGSTASGNVSGGSILGGLVGLNEDGQITNSSAEGSITGTSGNGDISYSMHADVNGLVEYSFDTNFDGIIDVANSIDLTGLPGLAKFHATGNIKGGNIVGGLVGLNAGGMIDGATASGNVNGGSILGSLVGLNYNGQITNSLATGSVTSNDNIGIITLKEYITVLGFTVFQDVFYMIGGNYVGGQIGLDCDLL
ncbi:MAG: filamentous hemagglutinin N-terminal domain-containing protein [Syntrophaceae bacterium]|nr:filamentous hemagglutinin N-terminal domain-containing protein [Syntrophaceae bacterium]